MALPGFKLPTSPGGASGMEMMLRSLGMGEAIDAAKALAENGTVDKIIQFSEGLNELNQRLDRIEAGLLAVFEYVREHGERSDVVAGISEPGAEPGAGSAAGRSADLPDVGSAGAAAAGRSGRARVARMGNGRGNGGIASADADVGTEE